MTEQKLLVGIKELIDAKTCHLSHSGYSTSTGLSDYELGQLASQIHTLYKEAGYKSPEEVAEWLIAQSKKDVKTH